VSKRKPQPPIDDAPTHGHDRPLPHDLAAEKAVLGAMLVDHRLIPRVVGLLQPSQFYRAAHHTIADVLITLSEERKIAPDLITVMAELKRRGLADEVGGPAYLSALTDGVPRSSNVEHYARIVSDHAQRREAIRVSADLMTAAYDGTEDPEAIIGEADKRLIELQRAARSRKLVDMRHELPALLEDLERRSNRTDSRPLGQSTGFENLDEVTSGWQPGDMVVVAARPSIGKTAFALNSLVDGLLREGKVGAIFSLEMKRRQLEYRIMSRLSGVPLTRVLNGWLDAADYELLAPAMTVMDSLALHIDDRARQTVPEIRAACRLLQAEQGLHMVVVDYFQLLTTTEQRRGASREEGLAEMSRTLKVLADELDVPVLLLSQLNRAGEHRADPRPKLSDLRGTGALEQDADLVIFLHRENHRESGLTECIIEKARNAATGTVTLHLTRETQTFTASAAEPAQQALPSPPPEDTGAPRRRSPPRGWKRG
jgi:replicative DNA helicase